jgi:hypothetical protein
MALCRVHHGKHVGHRYVRNRRAVTSQAGGGIHRGSRLVGQHDPGGSEGPYPIGGLVADDQLGIEALHPPGELCRFETQHLNERAVFFDGVGQDLAVHRRGYGDQYADGVRFLASG